MLGWLAKLQSTTHPFTAVVDVVFEAGNTQTDTDTQRWGPAMPPINIDAPLLMSKRTQQDSNRIFIGTVGRADRGERKEVDGQKWTERGGGADRGGRFKGCRTGREEDGNNIKATSFDRNLFP